MLTALKCLGYYITKMKRY